MKQGLGLLAVICLSVSLVGCGHSEQERRQAEIERANEIYKQQLATQEAELEKAAAEEAAKPTEFAMPPLPPIAPEPVVTTQAVLAMTNPELVAKVFTAKDPQVRLTAAHRLGVLAAEKPLSDAALQALINTFDGDEDAAVLAAAAEALGKTCHPAAMVRLLNNLKRPVSDVNAQAIVVLGEVAGFSATQTLDSFVSKLQDDKSVLANDLRTKAEQAKERILSRSGRRVNCSW